MPVDIVALCFLFLIMSFVYLIVVMQLSTGFPPFYEGAAKTDKNRFQLFEHFPKSMALIFVPLALTALTTQPFFAALTGFVCAWNGWRIRNRFKAHTTGIDPWFLPVFIPYPSPKYKMLVFDAWTLLNAFGFGAFVAISFSA